MLQTWIILSLCRVHFVKKFEFFNYSKHGKQSISPCISWRLLCSKVRLLVEEVSNLAKVFPWDHCLVRYWGALMRKHHSPPLHRISLVNWESQRWSRPGQDFNNSCMYQKISCLLLWKGRQLYLDTFTTVCATGCTSDVSSSSFLGQCFLWEKFSHLLVISYIQLSALYKQWAEQIHTRTSLSRPGLPRLSIRSVKRVKKSQQNFTRFFAIRMHSKERP